MLLVLPAVFCWLMGFAGIGGASAAGFAGALGPLAIGWVGYGAGVVAGIRWYW